MRPIALFVVTILLVLPACGAANDPSPENEDEDVTVRAGGENEGRIVLRRADDDWDDDYDPDLDAWKWEDHVRQLPSGFSFQTLEVQDDDDGWRAVTYEIEVAPWVRPGHYEVRVTYEFWPENDLFRDKYRVEFDVRVRPDRTGGTRRLVVEMALPKEVPEITIASFVEMD